MKKIKISEAINKKHQYIARFVKKDGMVRSIRFRTDVISDNPGGLSYDPNSKGLKLVWDTDAKGWRMINVLTTYELIVKGKRLLNNEAQAKLIEL